MPQDYFGPIQEGLTKLKPLLAYLPVTSTTPREPVGQLKASLEAVKNAVEAYGGRRKSKRVRDEDDAQKADWLDSEGVSMWNQAKAASRKYEGSKEVKEDLKIAALVRLTAFKMIQAASETKIRPAQLHRDMHLLCRTMEAVLASEDHVDIEYLLMLGADYEESIRASLLERPPAEVSESLGSIMDFYLARVDAAVADDKPDLASSLGSKALDLGDVGDLKMTDLRRLAHKCWSLSEKFCYKGASQLQYLDEAISWAGMSLKTAAELQKNHGEGSRWIDIEKAALQTMARAYRYRGDPEALDDAAVPIESLQGLTDEGDLETRHAVALYTLAITVARGGLSLKKDIKEVVETMVWSIDDIHAILYELDQLKDGSETYDWAMTLLLNTSLHDARGYTFVGVILLNLLCTLRARGEKEPDQTMSLIRQLLDNVQARTYAFMVDAGQLAACENILYGLADQFLDAKRQRYDQIAEWYLLAGHKALSSDNINKILRKAAMCFVLGEDFDKARDIIKKCPSLEASTQYLNFLVAINQGQETSGTTTVALALTLSAIQAIDAIVSCKDLDAKQLLSMASLAQGMNNHAILRSCLEKLVERYDNVSVELASSKIELLKALIHLTMQRISDEKDSNAESYQRLQSFFQSALQCCTDEEATVTDHPVAVAWIAKTAFNAGLQGASVCPQDLVSDLFYTAAELMTRYVDANADITPEWHVHLSMARYACFCGKMFGYREMAASQAKMGLLRALREYLPKCQQQALLVIRDKANKASVPELRNILDALAIFEIELVAEAKEWDVVAAVIADKIKAAGTTGQRVESLESIMDIVSRYADCPNEITGQLLDAILGAFTTKNTIDVEAFSRWARAAISALRSRGQDDVDEKCLEYIKHALGMIKSSPPNTYPQEEAEWLMTDSWNCGINQVDCGNFAAAQPWWDLAIQIGFNIPNREAQQQYMHDHNNVLLAKISAGAS